MHQCKYDDIMTLSGGHRENHMSHCLAGIEVKLQLFYFRLAHFTHLIFLQLTGHGKDYFRIFMKENCINCLGQVGYRVTTMYDSILIFCDILILVLQNVTFLSQIFILTFSVCKTVLLDASFRFVLMQTSDLYTLLCFKIRHCVLKELLMFQLAQSPLSMPVVSSLFTFLRVHSSCSLCVQIVLTCHVSVQGFYPDSMFISSQLELYCHGFHIIYLDLLQSLFLCSI